jgi:hypothetical protein
VRNSTIAGNTPNAGHGGDEIVYSFGTLELQETLVAGGTAARGASCGGPVPPPLLGHNLDDDASCGPRGAGDPWGADLRLGPLQDNGGPTPTRAVLERSAAIDAGEAARRPPSTSRGVARPQRQGVRHQRLRGRAAASPACGTWPFRLRASACERETPTGIERPIMWKL